MNNPYLPLPKITLPCMAAVLRSDLAQQKQRAKQWQLGRDDRLAGEPCKSANGAYLEGWYSLQNDYKA